MGLFRKNIAKILVFCLIFGMVWHVQTAETEASTSWSTEAGTITVTPLDGDFKDGKYRFNVKITYDTRYAGDVDITDIKLVNSSGKTMTTWKNIYGLLSNGGSITEHFSVDFSKYSSGKYTFKYCVSASDWRQSISRSFSTSVNHSAGSIAYSSCKYVYDTTGNKQLEVKFKVKGLKGYTPKVQIYNEDGKLIRTFPSCGKISSDDSVYTCTWRMTNDEGVTVKKGSYTMKFTANGKSCCKKFTIDPY